MRRRPRSAISCSASAARKRAAGQPSLSDCSTSFAHIDLVAGRRKSESTSSMRAASTGLLSLPRIIPRSRHDPKILWVDDAEIVGDRITKVRPILRNLFTQKTERRIGELRASCVALVVSDVSVHEAP